MGRTAVLVALIALEVVQAIKLQKTADESLQRQWSMTQHKKAQPLGGHVSAPTKKAAPKSINMREKSVEGSSKLQSEHQERIKETVNKKLSDYNAHTGPQGYAKEIYPSHKACLDDPRNEKLTHADFAQRKSVLQWARPYLYTKTALHAYKEAPKIEKIFYVNLDSDERRREFMEEQLQQTDVPYERWLAKDYQDIASQKVENGVPHECWEYSSGGMAPYLKELPPKKMRSTIAVYLSQASLLKHIKQINGGQDKLYVVMEDDAKLWKNWHVDLMEKVKTLPEDWDIARFVFWGAKRCQDKVPNSDWYEVKSPDHSEDGQTSFYGGNTAYIVRAKNLQAMMEQFRTLPIMDVDGVMGSAHTEVVKPNPEKPGETMSTAWGVHTYALDKPLGDHAWFGSSSRVANSLNGEENPLVDVIDAVWNPTPMKPKVPKLMKEWEKASASTEDAPQYSDAWGGKVKEGFNPFNPLGLKFRESQGDKATKPMAKSGLSLVGNSRAGLGPMIFAKRPSPKSYYSLGEGESEKSQATAASLIEAADEREEAEDEQAYEVAMHGGRQAGRKSFLR